MSDKPTTFQESLALIGVEADELMVRKQKDYGPRNIMDFGLTGVIVRMNDKMARLKNMLEKGTLANPENESLRDTLLDMRNYATIGLMLDNNAFDLPLEDAPPQALPQPGQKYRVGEWVQIVPFAPFFAGERGKVELFSPELSASYTVVIERVGRVNFRESELAPWPPLPNASST